MQHALHHLRIVHRAGLELQHARDTGHPQAVRRADQHAAVLALAQWINYPSPATPRTPDGKPNLNGIWQTNNTANWNIEAHAAQPSPVVAMGALAAMPAGLGVVDGEIPYLPAARAKQKENFAIFFFQAEDGIRDA